MANQWRYRIGKSNNGPVSSKQLKQLCNEGIVEPDTPIRRNDMEKWIRAKSVKGLFETEETKNTFAQESENGESVPFSEGNGASMSHPGEAKNVPLRYRLPVIIPLLICCFPIALVLIWKRPDWTRKKKWIWTGAIAAFFLFGQVSMTLDRNAANRRVEAANKAWDSGDTTNSVIEYQELLKLSKVLLTDSQEILIYSRLVEHAIENGHEGEARRLMKESGEFASRLALSSEAAIEFHDNFMQNGNDGSSNPRTPSNDEMVRLIAEIAAASSAGFDTMLEGEYARNRQKYIEGWSNTTPALFESRMRFAARQLSADNYEHSKHLLTISPTETKRTTVEGTNALIVVYGDWSANVTIYFMEVRGRFQLFRVDAGDEQWTVLGRL